MQTGDLTYSGGINSIPSGDSKTGAIAGGVAAAAALLFAVPAIGFAWWRRRKPEEHFFDVPGWYYSCILQFMILMLSI